jgi:PAS domain S-box-containing protein
VDQTGGNNTVTGEDHSAKRSAAADSRRSIMEATCAAVGVLAIVVVAVASLWHESETVSRKMMREEMSRLAASLSWTVDAQTHRQLDDPSEIDTPVYDRAIALLRKARATTPGVKYMYTAVADGDTVRFVLDAAEPGDHDGDGREDRAGVWEPYEDAEDVIWDALGRNGAPGVATASLEPYTAEWGTFVTGYAPFFDANGRQAGVIAVDIDAAEYMRDQANRRMAALLGLLPGGLLSCGVGIGAYLLRRRQLRTLREVEAASEDAAACASMLAESEGRFRSLADAMPVLVWTSDIHGDCDYVNRGWMLFTGRDRELELGRGWLESVHPEDRERVASTFAAAFQLRGDFEAEFRLRRADGQWRSVLSRGTPRQTASGAFGGLAGACLDMTEQREAEATVRTSERRVRAVIDTALDAVITLDDAGRVTDWNPQAEQLFGYSVAEATARFLSDLVLPLESSHGAGAGFFRSLANAQSSGVTRRSELAATRSDGKRLLVELSCSSVQTERGSCVSVFARDIAERKTAELSQQSALRLSTRLARASSVEEAARAVNDSLENMTGLSRTAILLFDQSAVCRFVGWRGISREYRQAVDGHCPWRMDQGEADPIVVQDVETDEAWADYRDLFRREKIRSLAFVPVRTEEGVVGKLMLYGDAMGDITTRIVDSARTAATYLGVAVGRLLAQERTRSSEKLFRLLVENTDDLVDLDPLSGASEYVGPAFERLIGCDGGGGTTAAIESRVAPDDLAAYRDAKDDALHGERARIECRLLRADGTTIWVDLHMVPVFDADGSKVIKILHSARDITDRKAFEDKLAQARVAAEAASRAKTEFLANMSHEIRTPLTAILGYADVLAEESGAGSTAPRAETVQTIKRAGEHLLSVVNDILDISKIEAGAMQLERVDTTLPQVFGAVRQLMQPRAEAKGVAFEVVLETPVPDRVVSDPTRLRQILLNLTGNAVKFTSQGLVRMVIRYTPDGTRGTLTVDVEDTGPGLTQEQAARLFQPFSQADASVTRKHGGTGLGLSICRRLARLLDGDVELVRSEPGKGSCFRLSLHVEPAQGSGIFHALEGQAAAKAEVTPAAATKLGGRIIVAEDGPDNQRLIRMHLTKAGAQVDVAENGRIALEMIEKAADAGAPYDLLVTDMQMPEMDGYTLASALRASGSTLAIVALTAHAMAEDRQRCLNAGCDDYATKPIDKASLLATCARWISQPGGRGFAKAA